MAKISKIMQTDAPTLKKDAKIEDAAKLLDKTKVGCIVVLDNNSPVGIVTELDLVRNIVSQSCSLKSPLSKVMSSPVTFMAPDMKLDEALKIIDTKRFRKYPVVENKRLVGLITKRDVVHAISDNLKFHRNIQNAVLVLFVLFELFVFIVNEYLNIRLIS